MPCIPTNMSTARLLKSMSRISSRFLRNFRGPFVAPSRATNLYSRPLMPGPVIQQRLHTTQVLASKPAAAVLKKPDGYPSVQGAGESSYGTPYVNIQEKHLIIEWDAANHVMSHFHHIWLRDHCRCPLCFHSVTKQRLVDTSKIPLNVKPIHVSPLLDGLEVVWPEINRDTLHTSFYPWSWLQTNSYDPQLMQQGSEKVLWGAHISQSPPSISHDEVMNSSDDHGVWKWLSNIDTYGFSFVTGVPPTPEATEALARRIGFIRETQYGTFWDFTSDLSKGDTAYTSLALTAHTDNTYFTDPAGLQLFHLVSHKGGSGGASLLVDGFRAASLMAAQYPDLHELLASISVPAHAAGEEGSLYRPKRGSPVLEYERSRPKGRGDLIQVRWNNHDRSVLRGIPSDLVEGWYEAARMWNRLITSPDAEYWVQLTHGTAVVMDNHRVLHGRSAFTGARRMCGAYIGWDEYQSRLAVLDAKFARGTELGVWSHNF